MIQVPAQATVFVMHEPVNFRNGIDGLAGVARSVLDKEPISGAFFVFRNKRRHMLRLLFYDGGGFWLCTRRLSKGTFRTWPAGGSVPTGVVLDGCARWVPGRSGCMVEHGVPSAPQVTSIRP